MTNLSPEELAEVFRRWSDEEQNAFIRAAGLRTLLKAAKGEAGARNRVIVARRSTRCVVCGEPIQVGSDICWVRHCGAWHADCDRGRNP